MTGLSNFEALDTTQVENTLSFGLVRPVWRRQLDDWLSSFESLEAIEVGNPLSFGGC
jgi:hypothetical protein